ncbi:CLUMA_CG012740, isoform A [Clunio marinus]|uniref:CLUMA_CG012740, isoform A n=1 Tax=Clunio marinus TaxID=568069 RepID=A0A1J1IGN2_9DIPT|nr:CLUMA_CG012740, isoform A [Clunio marinus]
MRDEKHSTSCGTIFILWILSRLKSLIKFRSNLESLLEQHGNLPKTSLQMNEPLCRHRNSVTENHDFKKNLPR